MYQISVSYCSRKMIEMDVFNDYVHFDGKAVCIHKNVKLQKVSEASRQ